MHNLAERIRGAVPAGNGEFDARSTPGSAEGLSTLDSAGGLPFVVFSGVGFDLAIAVRPLQGASNRKTSGFAGGYFLAGHEGDAVVAHTGRHARAAARKVEARSRAHRGEDHMRHLQGARPDALLTRHRHG